MSRLAVPALAAVLVIGPTLCADAADAPATVAINAALTDTGRPPDDMARDVLRKPADILAFSGIKPGMRIAEFSPGNGYYTRLLSKLVGPKGRVYTVVPLANFRDARELREANEGKILPVDEALALADIKTYSNVTVLWENVGQSLGQFPDRKSTRLNSSH